MPPSARITSQSTTTVRGPSPGRSVTALSERPIRRSISRVRPPAPLRSRLRLVWVARGSIPYSAVTHPAPLASLHAGTPSATEAVQRTLVSPKDTRHEPSAYGAASPSSEITRSSPSPRSILSRGPAFPVKRVLPGQPLPSLRPAAARGGGPPRDGEVRVRRSARAPRRRPEPPSPRPARRAFHSGAPRDP